MSQLTRINAVSSAKFIHINMAFLLDQRLSWRAKGIFAYLMSRPGDWEVRTSDLIARSTDQQTSFYNGIHELIVAGYVYRCIRRNRGQMAGLKYCVFEEPTPLEVAQQYFGEGWELAPKDAAHEKYQFKENQSKENQFKENQNWNTEVPRSNYTDSRTNEGAKNNEEQEQCITERSSVMHLATEDAQATLPYPGPRRTTRRIMPRSNAELTRFKRACRKANKEELYGKAIANSTRAIIEYWNGHRLTKNGHATAGTKRAQEINDALLRLRQGIFFNDKAGMEQYHNRPFTNNEIYAAIDNFFLALSPDYIPTNKTWLRKRTLLSFIYEDGRFSSNGQGKSLLCQFLIPPKLAKLSARPIPDPNPIITKIFKEAYVQNACGGADIAINEMDMNRFRGASRRLIDFYSRNKNKLADWATEQGEIGLAHFTVRALAAGIDDNWAKVSPGWFDSDFLFNRTLPQWLTRDGAFDQSWLPQDQEFEY